MLCTASNMYRLLNKTKNQISKTYVRVHTEKQTSIVILKIISEDRKLQTLHLIGNAAYERKWALTIYYTKAEYTKKQ